MSRSLISAGAILIMLCALAEPPISSDAACSSAQTLRCELTLSHATSCDAGAVETKAAPSKAAAVSRKGGQAMLEKIHWLGHDCFRVDAEKIVYFDPFELGAGAVPADVIFISHDHFDHCSPGDVSAITKKGTVVVTTTACAKKLSGETKIVKPGDKLTVQGISVEVVPAYNTDPARAQFHPRSSGGVGFIVTLGKKRIYHAGDTDFIPEMKSFKVDIAMLPVSGKYVMTAEDAVKAVQAIKPEITIPMHYGGIVGSRKDAETLKKLVAPLRVEILTSEKK
jgi:L-ascorbate metabolism protein UlaG (beta-lactamase superfamily)